MGGTAELRWGFIFSRVNAFQLRTFKEYQRECEWPVVKWTRKKHKT